MLHLPISCSSKSKEFFKIYLQVFWNMLGWNIYLGDTGILQIFSGTLDASKSTVHKSTDDDENMQK